MTYPWRDETKIAPKDELLFFYRPANNEMQLGEERLRDVGYVKGILKVDCHQPPQSLPFPPNLLAVGRIDS